MRLAPKKQQEPRESGSSRYVDSASARSSAAPPRRARRPGGARDGEPCRRHGDTDETRRPAHRARSRHRDPGRARIVAVVDVLSRCHRSLGHGLQGSRCLPGRHGACGPAQRRDPSCRRSCSGNALAARAIARKVPRRRFDRGLRRYVARPSSGASPPPAPRGTLRADDVRTSTSWPRCGPPRRGSRRGRTRLAG